MNSASPATGASTLIPAQSRRQVMDWSLVLTSQSIPTTIIHSGAGWGLEVAPGDYEAARRAILQFRAENRAWEWRRSVPLTDSAFHMGALAWCLLLILVHWSTVPDSGFGALGRFQTKAVASGEWWRTFTAMLLHQDLSHLLANTTLGFLIWGFAMGRYGAGLALLASYLSGAVGNLGGYFLAIHPYSGLGASGMLMGALGLIAMPPLRKPLLAQPWRHFGRALFAGVFLFLLLGTSPSSDVIAHTGGFMAGLILGALLNLLPAGSWSKWWMAASAWLLGSALLLITTWLALTKGSLTP